MTRRALIRAIERAFPDATVHLDELPHWRLDVVVSRPWWTKLTTWQRVQTKAQCLAIVHAYAPVYVDARVRIAPLSWTEVLGDVALVLSLLALAVAVLLVLLQVLR